MSSNYWRDRAKKREAEAKKEGERLKKELFEEYEKAIKDIDNKISVFYAKYAKNNKITAVQAMKRLSELEFRQWKKSLEEYEREIEEELDEVKRAELKARLDALSYNSQISRLEALKEQIGASISSMSVKGQNKMTEGLSGIFASSMTKKAYDLSEKGLKPNIKIREKIFDENLVKEVLSYPWSGADYSERLWKNTSTLSAVLKQELTQGMIKGTALPQISKTISEKMGQSFKVSERLIETETSRIHEEAQFKVYEAGGIEEYEFMAEKELTTCSICGKLDGKHFKLSERVIGVNCNPMHPNCHCTTIEYDPEERLDYERSELEYKPRQTYKEWLEEQRTIYGEEKLNNEFKKLKNKSADEKQYEKYKEALGEENMPKSLAEFQKLKYNKGEEWKKLKQSYRSSENKDESEIGDKIKSLFSPKSDKLIDSFKESIENVKNEDVKILLEQSVERTKFQRQDEKGSKFKGSTKTVYLGSRATKSTIAHELFHEIDHTYGLTVNGALAREIQADWKKIKAFAEGYGGSVEEMLFSRYPEAFITNDTKGKVFKEEYRGIADILNGMSKGDINLGYYHRNSYWERSLTLEKETWAQLGRIYYDNNDNVIKMAEELFIKTNKEALRILKEMIK